MGENRLKERYFLEIWLPQLAFGIDIEADPKALTEEIAQEIFEELQISWLQYTVISMLSERDLRKDRSLWEEGVRSGDKLMIVYTENEEQEDIYAGVNCRLQGAQREDAHDGRADQ